MGLFGNKKELQFRTCDPRVNHGKPRGERRGTFFIEKNGGGDGVQRGTVNKESIGGNWEFKV